MVLGRNLLGNPQVSRRHARIWFNGGLYYIQDTGSRNGTSVNGIRVTGSAQLQHGSYVYFGPEQFQFLQVSDKPSIRMCCKWGLSLYYRQPQLKISVLTTMISYAGR